MSFLDGNLVSLKIIIQHIYNEKNYDNHGSGNEIYFPIGSMLASITGVEVQILLTHYHIVAF